MPKVCLRLEKVPFCGWLLLQGANRSTWQIRGLSNYGNVLPSFVGQQERQLGAEHNLLKLWVSRKDACSEDWDGSRDD